MFKLTMCPSWLKCGIYEKFEESAKWGFKAIEILNWLGLDLDRLRFESERTGVAISAILFNSADPEIQEMISADYGIVHSDALDAFLYSIHESINAAKTIGTKNIIVTTGNEITGVPRQEQHDNVVKALRASAPLVEEAGITLVLEPLNILVDHKGYFLTTTKEAVEIIKEVDSPNVLLLYDVYHQQITEGNLINNIRDNIQYIGHIHIGDVPGRNQPGTGEINYKNVFKSIKDTGYEGFVVFECGLTEDISVALPKIWTLLED